MAPLPPTKNKTPDERRHNLLEIARRTCKRLDNRDTVPKEVEQEVELAIKRAFPTSAAPSASSKSSELDSQGCKLWNAATNILREQEASIHDQSDAHHKSRIVPLLRVFAAFLIETAYRDSMKHHQTSERLVRCFKTALKACRCCLENGELDLALKVLESCAEHASATETESSILSSSVSDAAKEERAILDQFTTEFYLLRITHAWKSERLDLSAHFFNKLSSSQIKACSRLSEKSGNLFQEIGSSLVKRQLCESAMIWLDRALGVLDSCDDDNQALELLELRLSTVASLVECLLHSKDFNSIERAQRLVDDLCTMHGLSARFAVHLMQLQIILARSPIAVQPLRNIISRIVRSTMLTDETFKLIMKSIHRIRHVDADLAYDALVNLLDTRLLDNSSERESIGDDTWIRVEQVVVTYTYFATMDAATHPNAIEGLRKVFDSISRSEKGRFSSKATHAAQALMWKTASKDDPAVAPQWCDLLRHVLFDGAGQINKDKVARKAISMAIERDNLDAGRAIFFQMAPASQNDSTSRYLAFKLALRSNDYHLAEESLQLIAKQAKPDQTFLYACVLVAQQSDMRSIAVAALQAILDKQPGTAHLPSLLRCTARLLIGELNRADREMTEVMEELIRVFENAARNITTLKKTAEGKWRDEAQWWSKNAYNLSIELCGDIPPPHLVRLLNVCATFIEARPLGEDTGPDEESFRKRAALCHFLCAVAHIVMARSSDKESEGGLQNYLDAQRKIAAFKSIHLEIVGNSHTDFNMKMFELLKFDLECILHLRQWDRLDAALQECLNCQQVDRWDTLADIVLVIREQISSVTERSGITERMNKLLDTIINQTWQRDKNIVKASRWLRLSFSMDLNNSNGDFALDLLKQAANMAKKGYGKEDGAFPETELQWLATTAFNKAVDCLSASMVDSCMNWIQAALELARYADDHGALHAKLTDGHGKVMARLKQIRV